MKAIICDNKSCGKIIEGEQQREHRRENEECSVVIGFKGDQDLCGECARKIFARAARATWDDLKQRRGERSEENQGEVVKGSQRGGRPEGDQGKRHDGN